MLQARLIDAFNLGTQHVIVCETAECDPMRFLNRTFTFYSQGRAAGRILITGVSTASDRVRRRYDFTYTGDEIRAENLEEASFIRGEPA